MKKIFALLLALMMVFALVACGDNGDNPGNTDNPGTSQGGENNNGSTTSMENISVDNWQQLVKECFGVDITVPNGWELTNVKNVGKNGVYIYFNPNNADETAVLAFLESIFNDLKGVTTGDITGHYDDLAYTSMSEAWDKAVDAFNMPINETADGDKNIYFSYAGETKYGEDMKEYWEELQVYLNLTK